MKSLETTINIQATPEQVWNVLVDFPNYINWNPFVRKAEGNVAVGETLSVFLQAPGMKGMTFKPTVINVKQHQEFRWLGRFIMPGLFDGEHIFKIEKVSEDEVRFTQSELFRGMLVPLMGSMLEKTRFGFEQMNEAIKKRVESNKTGA